MTPTRFTTARLTVDVWSRIHPTRAEQVDDVRRILTPATTRYLPSAWSGHFDADRAEQWIDERDETILLATESNDGRAVGFVMLSGETEIQLGYVIAEEHWGRGLASELVTAFALSADRTINAGVAEENTASILVLERAGFRPAGTTPHGDLEYRFEST